MDYGYIAEQMGYWLLPVIFLLLCIRSIRRHGVHRGSMTFAVIMAVIDAYGISLRLFAVRICPSLQRSSLVVSFSPSRRADGIAPAPAETT